MAFNRVALAAALLEYDNDNPASGLAPRKARESAIILGAAAAPPPPPHQRPDIRASSVGRDGQRAQQQQHRFSGIGIIEDRGSTYGYIPGRPAEEEEQGEMDMAEVDLSSWGLPETFLPPQQIRDQRPTYRVDTTTDHTLLDRITSPTNSTYAQNVVKSAVIASPSNRRNRKGRTVSFHDYTSVLYNHNNNDSSTPANREDSEQDPMEELAQHQHEPQDMAPYSTTVRPRSSMSVMNRGRPTSPFNAPHAQASLTATTASSFILSPTGSVAPLHVPLPPSPGQGQGHGVYQQHQIMEMVSTPTSPTRLTCEPLRHGDANPFALPAPAGRRVSRFDPKITTPSPAEMQGPAQADGGVGPPRASYNAGFGPVSQASGYFPPLIHTHDQSHRAAATSIPPLPAQQPSTISRLRPRTLLMPAPLHGVLDPTQSGPLMPSRWDTEGFSRGAKPLPPGALTRPDSFVGKLNDQEGSGNKGRPPAPFSSTRQLFRVTLAGAGVDGKMRDSHGSGYTGYEAGFMDVPPSAERDGEVGVQQYGGRGGDDDDDEGSEYGDEDYVAPRGEHDWRPETRFVQGPSLMDRLEARKAELRSKQRVFRGDNRPAMMSRSSAGPLVNLDAAVDPLTGQTSPGLQKRASLVLQDDDGRPLVRSVSHGDPTTTTTTTTTTERPNMPSRGKSVFGVDTLWEKELRKLEAQQESERGLALQMEARRRKKGGKKAKKGKRQEGERSSEQEQEGTRGAAAADDDDATHPYTQTMHSQGRNDTGMPPSLSLGDLATALHAPFNPAQGAISNTNANPHTAVDVDDWAVGSDEDGPAAVQPRRRKRRTVGPVPVPDAASDSEDDVPLAKAFGVTRAKSRAEESDSSEDEPLSNLKSKVSNRIFDAADEDDIPLALRRAKRSGAVPAQHAASPTIDEDDVPLAQRRLRVQETGIADPGLQQQHLAMAMQHQSMMMNPMMSMYGGVGMMGMPMMGMPSPMGMMPGGAPPFGVGGAFNNASTYPMPHAPPPPPDPKIDRWRREIEAREGSMISAPPSVVTSGGRT